MAKAKTAHCPLILRAHRMMDAFAKSDDERDFYLDRNEGFLVFADLNRMQEELDALDAEIRGNSDRYCPIPKMSFYEAKKIMEGFVNEKVYDIDIKEKLLDIIHSKDPRENFLEFLHDHLPELEKWLQYYQERSRIRIIEWLRQQKLIFVFEEDLTIPAPVVEKLKTTLFQGKVARDVAAARKVVQTKSESYYSNEALNPRPKRGRPPKHVTKVETEPQITGDFYQTVPTAVRLFLFTPDITSVSSVTFSSKFDTEEEFRASLESSKTGKMRELDELEKKLASLHNLSAQVSQIQKE